MKVVKKNSVQNEVYKVLKNAIMMLKLVPGTVMSTQEMADRLQVSRTPVREAFIRLHEEGLVHVIPQRETIVSRIDMKRVMEERFIRESLELAVIDPFLENCTPAVIAQLRMYVEEQKQCSLENKNAEFTENDDKMHRVFFIAADRELAWETLQGVNGHDYRYRVLAVQNEEIRKSALAQHERIIEYIASGDREMARKELVHHLRKINLERTQLMEKYPDYFLTEENKAGFRIGQL